MKKYFLFVNIVILCCTGGFAQETFPTVEDLSKRLIKAFRKADTTLFDDLYTHDSIFVEYFSDIQGEDFKSVVKNNFTSILEEGNYKGIEWTEIRYVKVEYITTMDDTYEKVKPAVIIFKHRLFRYAIELNCMKINGSWGFIPIEIEDEKIKMITY